MKHCYLLAMFFAVIFSASQLQASSNDWHKFQVTRDLENGVLPTRAEHLQYFPETPFQVHTVNHFTLPRDNPNEEGTVFIAINSKLYDSLDTEFDDWVADILEEGYSVSMATTEGGTAQELKDFMVESAGDDLVGVIFVGEQPLAFMEHAENFYTEDEPDNGRLIEYPIDLFFMDLDGVWEDTTGNGVYDYHHGDVLPEIWLGRLPAHNLSHMDEVEVVESYLARVHAYRSGELNLPHRALNFIDDDWALSAGTWERSMRFSYGMIQTENDPNRTSVTNYVGYLEGDGLEYVQVAVHSTSDSHSFFINDHHDRDYFRFFDLRDDVVPNAMFYNLFACSIMNMAGGRNLCMGVLYAMGEPYGLGSVGSTKTGGMLFWDDYYIPLSEGKSMGEALRLWMVEHITEEERPNWARSWFYGMTHYGDPTLKLHLGLRAGAPVVSEDNDEDTVPDAGESGVLAIPIINHGDNDFNNVNVTVSSADAWIELSDNEIMIDNISPDDETFADGFQLAISDSCQDNHIAVIAVQMDQEEGESWQDQIELTVRAPRLEIVGIGWSEIGGNGNSFIEPGERGYFAVFLRNDGGDGMRDAGTVIFSSRSDGFRIESDTLRIHFLASVGETVSTISHMISLDQNIQGTDALFFSAVAFSGEIQRGQGIIAMPISPDFRMEDDFSSEPVWLNHYALTNGFEDPWRWLDGAGENGGALAVGGPDTLLHPPHCDAALELPVLMFASGAVLEIHHKFDIEPNFDACIVEVDRGDGWRKVTPEDGYNGFGVANGSFEGGSCWNGTMDWTTSRLPLGDVSGQLRIRFRFSSDSGVEGNGWFIDSISIDGTPLLADDSATVPAEFGLQVAYPNPFNARLTVRYTLEDGAAQLTMHDLNGRLVANLSEHSEKGSHAETYNLSHLPSSVYILNLTQNGKKSSQKVVLLK